MADHPIAAAASGGKGAYDRSTVLRNAHAQARRLLTYGCSRGPYRQALAAGLTLAWQAAKAEREEADWQDTQPPIPADIANRIRELSEAAWYEPISSAGNERYYAMLAQARDPPMPCAPLTDHHPGHPTCARTPSTPFRDRPHP